MNPALDQLKDVHLPADPSWWPPAPGWWVLACLALLSSVGMTIWIYRMYQRRAYRRIALRQLRTIPMAPAAEQLGALNQLLKRVALTAYPQEDIAATSGQAWLLFLTRHGQLNPAQTQALSRIVHGPYRPAETIPADDPIWQAARDWIRKHP